MALLFIFAALSALSAQLSPYSEYAWFFCDDFLRAVVISYLIAVLANDRWKLHVVLVVMVIGLSSGLRSVVLRDEHPGAASEPRLPALAPPGGRGT